MSFSPLSDLTQPFRYSFRKKWGLRSSVFGLRSSRWKCNNESNSSLLIWIICAGISTGFGGSDKRVTWICWKQLTDETQIYLTVITWPIYLLMRQMCRYDSSRKPRWPIKAHKNTFLIIASSCINTNWKKFRESWAYTIIHIKSLISPPTYFDRFVFNDETNSPNVKLTHIRTEGDARGH